MQSFYLLKQEGLNLPDFKKIITVTNPLSTFDETKLRKTNRGRIIIDLYRKEDFNILVEYDKCLNEWNKRYNGVFPANMDTLFTASFIKKRKKFLKKVHSAIDVGCGQGFLGQFLLKKFKELNILVFTDINPKAIELTKNNLLKYSKKDMKNNRILFNVGDLFKNIKEDIKFDLIVSNPPYVPLLNNENFYEGPYLGTYLLESLIKESKKRLNPGGHLILNYSSLSNKEVKSAIRRTLGKILAHKRKIVSFWAQGIIKNKRLLDFLIKKRGLKKRGNRYFQEIQVVDVVYP